MPSPYIISAERLSYYKKTKLIYATQQRRDLMSDTSKLTRPLFTPEGRFIVYTCIQTLQITQIKKLPLASFHPGVFSSLGAAQHNAQTREREHPAERENSHVCSALCYPGVYATLLVLCLPPRALTFICREWVCVLNMQQSWFSRRTSTQGYVLCT
jgi:hypothetical protein